MTKYGRDIHFGYALQPTASDLASSLNLATLCDKLGLHYIGMQHNASHSVRHDNWTLLTAIGTATSRIWLVANGNDMPSAAPQTLAKAVATLDILTEGRVEISLDVHRFGDALAALEGESRNAKEKVLAVEQAVQTMRGMWKVENGLRPAHPVTIWLNATDPDALALVGRYADGWIANHDLHISPSEMASLNNQIDHAAIAAGRVPADIKRIYNVRGMISTETASTNQSDTSLHGSAKQWAESLAQLAMEVGIDTFMLVQGDDAKAQLEKFVGEVVPCVYEIVATTPGVTFTTGLARAYQGAMASGPTRAEEATDDLDAVDETSMESFPASDPPASSSFT